MADGTRWIIEGRVDDRWPIYTRGNVGEVFPEVVTVFSYHYGVVAAERAWRDAYDQLGIQAKGDFTSDDPVILGLFCGYTYLNLSYLRMMGVRAPGSSAEAIDVAFFGEGDPPPYVPRKGDRSVGSTVRILRTVLKGLAQDSEPEPVAESFARVATFEARRPALDAPDAELMAYIHSFPSEFEPVFGNHMKTSALAAIVSGVLSDAAAAAGERGLVTDLIGAAGNVRSARYSQALYDLACHVRSSTELSAAFDAGIPGLSDRLAELPAAASFRAMFDTFIAEHGHRGPNDWELSARTWDNTPELALAAIDSMRRAEHDLSPEGRLAGDEARRQAAIERVRPHLGLLDRLNFDKAIKSVSIWAQAREATRDRAVRLSLPLKQVYRELVRRAAERGGHPNPVWVALLDPRSELEQYLADPPAMLATVTERGHIFERYSAIEPPFFVTAQRDVVTLEELEAAAAARRAAPTAAPGDVLEGDAGCSGVAEGVVRVVMDPSEGGSLQPGEILVAPLTDPAWTPLFLPAAAVVVNVGALMSHAVIVSRELAVPCVVAVDAATERLRTGMRVRVDGTAGTVTVLDNSAAGLGASSGASGT
ncbi:MAG: PEP-utilizing enzyme [Acidimicrobiia bacterium]|nr:PEP-utilizing enzyme [Acidimicrobiia bacterium]